MVIEVDVSNKIASLVNKSIVGVCGNSDYVIHFNFDNEWAAYETKTARFKYNGSYTDVIFTGTDCPMPIVQNTYNVEIGVYAGNLHTTTSAYLPMKKSILCGSGSPADPEPDVYNQLMDKLNNLDVKGYEELSGEMGNLDNLKTDAKDNLVEAINEAATVPDYNQNDETAPDYIKNRPFYDTREYNTAFVSELGNIEANGFYKLPNFTIDGITYVDYSYNWDGDYYSARYEISGIQDLSEEFGLDANSVLQVGLYNEENDWSFTAYYFISAEAIAAADFPATDGAGWYIGEYEGYTDVKLTGIHINGELKTIAPKYIKDMYYTVNEWVTLNNPHAYSSYEPYMTENYTLPPVKINGVEYESQTPYIDVGNHKYQYTYGAYILLLDYTSYYASITPDVTSMQISTNVVHQIDEKYVGGFAKIKVSGHSTMDITLDSDTRNTDYAQQVVYNPNRNQLQVYPNYFAVKTASRIINTSSALSLAVGATKTFTIAAITSDVVNNNVAAGVCIEGKWSNMTLQFILHYDSNKQYFSGLATNYNHELYSFVAQVNTKSGTLKRLI